MSRHVTRFRPLARMGWGGKAASHWRGQLTGLADSMALLSVEPQVLAPSWRNQIGTVVYRSPGGFANFRLSGVTKDSTGAALGSCRVELFLTAGDVSIAETTSGASGDFAFDMPGTGPFYLVAYKVGSPDVAGTTVNTLLPVAI